MLAVLLSLALCASASESTDAALHVYGYRTHTDELIARNTGRTEELATEPLHTQLRGMDVRSQKGPFYVHRHRLDKDDVLALSRTQGLTELDVRHCSIETGCLYRLRRMRGLRKLNIECQARLSRKDMAGIGKTAGLCELRIRCCEIEPGALSRLGKLCSLRHLHIDCGQLRLSSDEMRGIVKIKSLAVLGIFCLAMEPGSLVHLLDLSELAELHVFIFTGLDSKDRDTICELRMRRVYVNTY